MIKTEFFNLNDVEYYSYITIPIELIKNENFKKLSSDSKILYGLLLSRMKLSLKNEWFDSKGNVYLIYTIAEIQNFLNISKPTAIKILKELEKFDLIQIKKQGLTKPNIIYLRKLIFHNLKKQREKKENSLFLNL